MNPRDNPYTPGAGTPPPELAGRETILDQARDAIGRASNGRAANSLMMFERRLIG